MVRDRKSHRLTVITTRTGDDGSTGLADGSRVSKTSARIEALGALDETNSHVGVLRSLGVPQEYDGMLATVQHDLFDLGAVLAVPGHPGLASEPVERLEAWISTHNASLPSLQEFILPGGSPAAAQAHVCRSQARRAERCLLMVEAGEPLPPTGRQYLNRLSDLFFVLARCLNRHAGVQDVHWQRRN